MNYQPIHDILRREHLVVKVLYEPSNESLAQMAEEQRNLGPIKIVPAYIAFQGCDVKPVYSNAHLVYVPQNGKSTDELRLMCRRGSNEEEIDLNSSEWKTAIPGMGETRFSGVIMEVRKLRGWIDTWRADLETSEGMETLYKSIGDCQSKRRIFSGINVGDYVRGRAVENTTRWTDHLACVISGACWGLPRTYREIIRMEKVEQLR